MNSPIFKKVTDKKEADGLPFTQLCCYNWEKERIYRPQVYAKLYLLNENLCATLICREKSPKTTESERDGRIWCDSCLEFFVKPFDFRDEYINIEANSKGVFLSQFGATRENRVFLKELTDIKPVVSAFFGNDTEGEYWGVDIALSRELISSLYKIPTEKISFEEPFVNFYKCGDECEIPHYISMFPVTTMPPGFHNPACFKKYKLSL